VDRGQTTRRRLGRALGRTGLKHLTGFPAELNNTQPSWSADGSQIIFRSDFDLHPANIADIWVMNVDGKKLLFAATGTGSPATVTKRSSPPTPTAAASRD
jgi:Tol biopolymer transport system component